MKVFSVGESYKEKTGRGDGERRREERNPSFLFLNVVRAHGGFEHLDLLSARVWEGQSDIPPYIILTIPTISSRTEWKPAVSVIIILSRELTSSRNPRTRCVSGSDPMHRSEHAASRSFLHEGRSRWLRYFLGPAHANCRPFKPLLRYAPMNQIGRF